MITYEEFKYICAMKAEAEDWNQWRHDSMWFPQSAKERMKQQRPRFEEKELMDAYELYKIATKENRNER